MDREPLPPPFPVGTRLRYRGRPLSPYQVPGQEVEIVRTRPGHRGTLMDLTEPEDEEPIIDTTRDGMSVWVRADGTGRIIHRSDMADWEVL